MGKNLQPYEENGVRISKPELNVGDKVTLTYDGLLVKSGADIIFAHVGYGEAWEEKSFLLMETGEDVFAVTFKALHPGTLNVSFKDSADNWDNNSTENYSFKVLAKVADKKETVKKEVVKKVKDEVKDVKTKKADEKIVKVEKVEKKKK